MTKVHAINGSFVHSYLFGFEEYQDDVLPSSEWMKNNWTKTFYINALYLTSIYILQKFMRNRIAYQIKKSIIIWNILMICYSIFGAWRSLPDALYISTSFGVQTAACEIDINDIRLPFCWCKIFALGKIFELGDTYLMALQKKSIPFSHLIHHVLALTATWHYFGYEVSISYIFVSMNYFVHSFMFSYLLLKALKFQIPQFVPMTILLLNIVEMFTGFSLSVLNLTLLLNNKQCYTSYLASYFGCVTYGINFILFTRHFFLSYIFQRKVDIKRKKTM